MGLLEQEIKEIRIMNKRIAAGTISADEVHLRIAAFSQIEKRAKLMLSAFSIGAKFGKKALSRIEQSNLIGEGACIDLGTDADVETLFCPDIDKTINRHECLDYSGEEAHNESCRDCEQFSITRRILMGNRTEE